MPLPAIPAPAAWVTGQIITTPVLRADVAEAAAFVLQRPWWYGFNNSGPTWTAGMNAALPMSDQADNWNGHIPPSPSYYAQAPGWYLCHMQVPFPYTGAQAPFACGFSGVSNGTTFSTVWGASTLNGSGGTIAAAAQCHDLIWLPVTGAPGGAGDYVQCNAYNGSGSAVNLANSATSFPTVTIRWVAAATGTTGLAVPANPAWPVPPAYITSSFLNTNITQAIQFLTYPPICKVVYTPGSATIPSQAFPAGTIVPMGTVVVDNYGGYSTSANTYTAPVAGNYFVAGQVNFVAATGAASYSAGLSVGGGTIGWGDSVNHVAASAQGAASVTRRLRLTAGQTVALYAQQNSGAALALNTTTSPTFQTRLIAVWEGA